ncbi:fructose-2,6-bisphosphatase TIGAR-like isoform X3 [Branchiostoma floridae]|uniref:Fructose-2,6-bisphosphatase TIGAR n=1 Tax=Branchiostoma floridae TaxID=7739 RepID=A0A9J7HSQ9_BRAFL|nr:fructose-2,6-bisphosphatase TIGAR-like isoform X1 [Branchiostoma floridae]XP_035664846.1 fructose-2,6-bisphosphatase TIGAR-like isoform X2 [Branchiostoma floridae]XP_035664847.1 fructose-2,6-bisphosphatase TIGAR-like isoform X3 [Branchiostoma floridae]
MATFLLTVVRHGETRENKEFILQGQMNTNLSDVGYHQAGLAGKRLMNQLFTHVYTSDLNRVLQTSQVILDKNVLSKSPQVKVDKRLRERGFGEVEGKTVSELRALVEKSGQLPQDFKPPGGESPLQVKARAEAFFHDLCNDLAAEAGIGQVGTLQHAAMADGTAERDCGLEGNVLGEWNIEEGDGKKSGTQASNSTTSGSASKNDTEVTIASDSQPQNVGVSTASDSQTEDSEKYNARVLLVSHGGTIRELFRHLIDDLGCKVKSKRFAMQISPNCGISQFVVQLKRGKRPTLSCQFLHDKSHLDSALEFQL